MKSKLTLLLIVFAGCNAEPERLAGFTPPDLPMTRLPEEPPWPILPGLEEYPDDYVIPEDVAPSNGIKPVSDKPNGG